MTMAVDSGAWTIPIPRAFSGNVLFAGAGVLLLASALPTLLAMAVETRQFQGENLWIKPLKFQLSLGLHLLTLAWFARLLPTGTTARRGHRVYGGIVVFSVFAEVVWIGGAAMAATASHFNFDDPAMSAIYGLMGVFAVILTSPALVYGTAILRKPGRTPFELASGIALCLTFVLTLVVAGTLSNSGGHFVGVPGAAHATVPLLGWSREVGDLRIAHFLATHAMQILPVGAAILALALGGRWLTRAILASAAAYALLVVVAFVRALGGAPFWPVG